ncbi:uncharacterized protein LOC144803766 [Lissotriton helveticus]
MDVCRLSPSGRALWILVLAGLWRIALPQKSNPNETAIEAESIYMRGEFLSPTAPPKEETVSEGFSSPPSPLIKENLLSKCFTGFSFSGLDTAIGLMICLPIVAVILITLGIILCCCCCKGCRKCCMCCRCCKCCKRDTKMISTSTKVEENVYVDIAVISSGRYLGEYNTREAYNDPLHKSLNGTGDSLAAWPAFLQGYPKMPHAGRSCTPRPCTTESLNM